MYVMQARPVEKIRACDFVDWAFVRIWTVFFLLFLIVMRLKNMMNKTENHIAQLSIAVMENKQWKIDLIGILDFHRSQSFHRV